MGAFGLLSPMPRGTAWEVNPDLGRATDDICSARAFGTRGKRGHSARQRRLRKRLEYGILDQHGRYVPKSWRQAGAVTPVDSADNYSSLPAVAGPIAVVNRERLAVAEPAVGRDPPSHTVGAGSSSLERGELAKPVEEICCDLDAKYGIMGKANMITKALFLQALVAENAEYPIHNCSGVYRVIRSVAPEAAAPVRLLGRLANTARHQPLNKLQIPQTSPYASKKRRWPYISTKTPLEIGLPTTCAKQI